MIRIESRDSTGSVNFNTLNVDTLNYFTDLLNDKPKTEFADSTSELFDSYNDWVSIDLEFNINLKQHGGFFPFINKSSFPYLCLRPTKIIFFFQSACKKPDFIPIFARRKTRPFLKHKLYAGPIAQLVRAPDS